MSDISQDPEGIYIYQRPYSEAAFDYVHCELHRKHCRTCYDSPIWNPGDIADAMEEIWKEGMSFDTALKLTRSYCLERYGSICSYCYR